jgi:hypothetical protein
MSADRTYGEVFHAEYAAAQRRFMCECREWGDLAPTEQASIRAGAQAVAAHVTSTMAQPIAEPGAEAPYRPTAKFRAWMKRPAAPNGRSPAPEPGRWERIAFMGHIEHTGRVTRFDRFGEAAYRIELPDLVFGGNPLAYREHRASMWFSSEPVSEESVRAAWEARQLQRLRQPAPAIGSGAGWPYDEDDPDDEITAQYHESED